MCFAFCGAIRKPRRSHAHRSEREQLLAAGVVAAVAEDAELVAEKPQSSKPRKQLDDMIHAGSSCLWGYVFGKSSCCRQRLYRSSEQARDPAS